jgi:hypothetical protein
MTPLAICRIYLYIIQLGYSDFNDFKFARCDKLRIKNSIWVSTEAISDADLKIVEKVHMEKFINRN